MTLLQRFLIAAGFATVLLVFAMRVLGATKYTDCQRACNRTYQVDYRACRSSVDVAACRTAAWQQWSTCFYGCQ